MANKRTEAASRFGQLMCAWLEVLDMCDQNSVIRVLHDLVPPSQRKSGLTELAKLADAMGCGAVAKTIRRSEKAS